MLKLNFKNLISANHQSRFRAFGFGFGLLFPIFATVLEVVSHSLSPQEVWAAHTNLLFIISTAPLFLGAAGHWMGKAHDQLQILNTGLIKDLSEKTEETRNLHDTLIASERLAAIGNIAAGVGHEIRNPLSIVSGSLQLLKRTESSKLSENGLAYLKRADIAMARIQHIVEGLRTYARREKPEFVYFDPKQSLDETLFLFEPIYQKEGIQVRLQWDAPDCEIYGSPIHMGQVIMNLLSNAKDALEGRADAQIEIHGTLDSTQRLWVEVKDNGPGMTEEVQSKLFNSFITTKDRSKGTGLGLSLCQSLVKGMGGTISFESNEGRGTTFRVYLPTRAAAGVNPGETRAA